jgi:hypothetical protein
MEPVTLAGVAVALLATKAVEAAGGEAGKRLVSELWDKVKAKLAGKEALADVEAKPDDQRAWAALELRLEEALKAEPAFQEELEKLVGEIQEKGGERITKLVANVTGDRNVTTQIAGSGNQVTTGRA